MSELSNDLADAWAEIAGLKQELKTYKGTIDVLCRSHKNWQDIASELEQRLVKLGLATRDYLGGEPATKDAEQLKALIGEVTTPIQMY